MKQKVKSPTGAQSGKALGIHISSADNDYQIEVITDES